MGVEAYPALYKRRYPREGRSPDEHDAWATAAWLRDADHGDSLSRYLQPPLTPVEQRQAVLEGDLGAC